MIQGYLIFFLFALIWLLPLLDVYRSNKVSYEEKVLWLIGCMFISWWAWIFFYMFAPLLKKNIK